MTSGQPHDWTDGPAKWGAVIILGGASIAGMAWSIFWRQPGPRGSTPRIVQVAPPATMPAEPSEPAPIAEGSGAQHQAPPATPTTAPRPAPLNINTATAAELELLPGIGPVVAGRIIDHRTKNGPFKSITALDAVKGIGPKTIESLRPLVTVE